MGDNGNKTLPNERRSLIGLTGFQQARYEERRSLAHDQGWRDTYARDFVTLKNRVFAVPAEDACYSRNPNGDDLPLLGKKLGFSDSETSSISNKSAFSYFRSASYFVFSLSLLLIPALLYEKPALNFNNSALI